MNDDHRKTCIVLVSDFSCRIARREIVSVATSPTAKYWVMENGAPRSQGGQFAVPENVEECVGYINQTLQSVGLPAAVELTEGGKVSFFFAALNIC